VLRRDRVEHEHFRAPTPVPVIGAVVCTGLLTQREGETFLFAGALMLVGVALYAVSHALRARPGRSAPTA
jgi:hypothetical protein